MLKVRAAYHRGNGSRLGWGEYIGRVRRCPEAPGFYVGFVGACPAGVQPHEHDYPQLTYVLRGALETAAKRDGSVGRATAVFTPAGFRHSDQISAGGLVMNVGFAENLFRETDGYLRPLNEPRILSEAVSGLFREFVDECLDWTPLSPLVLEGLGMEILALAASRGNLPYKAPPWLSVAREKLDAEPLCGVADLAAAAGVHPVHFARTFRRFLGCSPSHYWRRIRLREAATRLLRSNVPLAILANDLGFSDQSHFTRSFRRAFNVPPASFRARHAL